MTGDASGVPKVSVIIPAYNGAATIDETLDSVRAQTLREIEIIVVDDGSTDATAERVERHMREDPRVRLLRTANGGVARARNTGIAEARSDLIAPVDADDLWHPEKLARQVEAIERGGDRVGLVYCWFALIDEESRIIGWGHESSEEGDVLRRLSLGNLVGNGSGPLMRKAAILEAGGYDPKLRDCGAQGCEDLALYYGIAERYHYAFAPGHLVGYRETSASMSSDGRRMLRSYDLVMGPARERHPELAREFHMGRTYLLEWLLSRAARFGTWDQFRVLFAETWKQSRTAAIKSLPGSMNRLRRRLLSRRPSVHYHELDALPNQLEAV